VDDGIFFWRDGLAMACRQLVLRPRHIVVKDINVTSHHQSLVIVSRAEDKSACVVACLHSMHLEPFKMLSWQVPGGLAVNNQAYRVGELRKGAP